MTSKLQVTLPKALAKQYRIQPGDDILWVASGDAIRVLPAAAAPAERSVEARLAAFDEATERQRRREGKYKARSVTKRGWTRGDLYQRGRAR